jgi:hypothetical protein
MVQARREFSILTKLGSRDGSGLAPSRGRHFSHLPQGPHLISFQSSATGRWSIFHRVSCVGSTRPVRDRTSPATSRARSEKRTTNRPNPLAARLSKTVERSEESPGLLFAGTNATIFKVCRDCTSSSCCFAALLPLCAKLALSYRLDRPLAPSPSTLSARCSPHPLPYAPLLSPPLSLGRG